MGSVQEGGCLARLGAHTRDRVGALGDIPVSGSQA
jgi:hypothetical protein